MKSINTNTKLKQYRKIPIVNNVNNSNPNTINNKINTNTTNTTNTSIKSNSSIPNNQVISSNSYKETRYLDKMKKSNLQVLTDFAEDDDDYDNNNNNNNNNNNMLINSNNNFDNFTKEKLHFTSENSSNIAHKYNPCLH